MHNRLRGPLALTVTLALTAELITGSSLEGRSDFSQSSLPATTAECPAPSPEALSAVEKLFDVPPTATGSQQKGETREAYKYRASQLEAKYGINLPDKTLEQQAETLYFEKAPTTAVLDKTRGFLQEFGVSLTVAQPSELTTELQLHADQIPTAKDLETHTAKYEIMELGEGFAQLPTQFFAVSGVKNIILAKNTGDIAYARIDGRDDTIVVDVGELDRDPTLAGHETTHLLDSKECGGPDGAYNDPAYQALNGSQNIYASENRTNETTYRNKLNDLSSVLIQDQAPGTSHEKACRDQKNFDDEQAKVLTYSDYGLTNVVEDKAEVGKMIAFPGNYGQVLDPRMPILRKKFELLMARLYERAPGVVRYLAAVSTRPYDSSTIHNC